MKRTFCHVCGKSVALKSDGTLRVHGQHRVNGRVTGDVCSGTDQYPGKSIPDLETPAELAEAIATMLHYQGVHSDNPEENCAAACRVCFVTNMTERIRNARDNEIYLQPLRKASCG